MDLWPSSANIDRYILNVVGFGDLTKVLTKSELGSTANLRTQRGFTLIEIMVVVVVIGVVSVAVVSSVGRSTDRSARLEAQRFMAVVNQVRDEAVIAGDNFALLVDDKAQTYYFQSVRATDNNDSDGDELLRVRSIREDVKVDWDVLEVIGDDPQAKPKVYISSLGEITPFEIRLSGDEHDYIVFVDNEGQLATKEKGSRFL